MPRAYRNQSHCLLQAQQPDVLHVLVDRRSKRHFHYEGSIASAFDVAKVNYRN